MLQQFFISDAGVGLVWIMGHSFAFWGARRADVCPNGRQLGVQREVAMVRWIGVPGMLWSSVLPEIHKYIRLDRAPDVLVLHVGGNDLGVRSMRHLIRDIKFDVLRIRTDFPRTMVVWSDVGRMSWRFARSIEKLNKTRIKVNKEMGRFIVRNGGIVVRHRELKVETYWYLRGDGVHLNAVGIDLWCLGLEDGVQWALL